MSVALIYLRCFLPTFFVDAHIVSLEAEINSLIATNMVYTRAFHGLGQFTWAGTVRATRDPTLPGRLENFLIRSVMFEHLLTRPDSTRVVVKSSSPDPPGSGHDPLNSPGEYQVYIALQ